MYTVSIFLDTSILYKDPFWKGNFASELLQLAKGKEIDVYMSSIVERELIRKYEKIIEDENIKLGKIVTNAEHYNFVGSLKNEFDKDESIKLLKKFYEDLYKNGIVEVLEYDNEFLPEIVDRAIFRRKPFGENKTELKDALIWLTYAKFVEEYGLDNCIFLTDNVNDFCDIEKIKKGEYVIHEDLLRDTKRFTVHRSIKTLLQTEKENLRVASVKFEAWVAEQKFDSAFVIKLLKSDFGEKVKHFVKNKFEYSNPNYFFKTKHDVEGFMAFSDTFYLHEVNDIKTDVFGEQCIVSGEVEVSCNTQGFEYFSQSDIVSSSRDHLAYLNIDSAGIIEDFRIFSEGETFFRVVFSFYYDISEKPWDLKIESADIVNRR